MYVHAPLNSHPETRARAFVRVFLPIRRRVINSRDRSCFGRTWCASHCSSSRVSVPWVVSRRAGNREAENRHGTRTVQVRRRRNRRRENASFLSIVLSSSLASTCSQPCRFARRSRLFPRSNDGRLLLPLSFPSWFLVNGWKSADSLPDRETYVSVSGSAFLSVAYAREFHWWSEKRSSPLTLALAILSRDFIARWHAKVYSQSLISKVDN